MTLTAQSKYNKKFNFWYEFQINNPPYFGLYSVYPNKGTELSTTFYFSATDWTDLEDNLPLKYSFGVIYLGSSIIISQASIENTFSTHFPFINSTISTFALVFDSLGDFTQEIKDINLELQENFDMELYYEDIARNLKNALTSEIPLILIEITVEIFNRDFYLYGSFFEIDDGNMTIFESFFNLTTDYLVKYVNSSVPSEELVNISLSVLQEISRNPYMNSDSNFMAVTEVIINIFELNADIDCSYDNAVGILNIVDNSINVDNSTIYSKSDIVNRTHDVFERLSKSLIQHLTINNDLKITSGPISFSSTLIDQASQTATISSSEHSNIILPQEIINSLDPSSPQVLSIINTNSTISESSVTPTLTYAGIFSVETKSVIKINSTTSYILIEIPVFGTENLIKPGCFFQNSSLKWSQVGCIVNEIRKSSIVCACNHLTFLSAGEGLEGNGFIPKNNFDQTTNIESLKSINAKSAIGFYFSGVMLFLYLLISLIALNKDSKDIRFIINTVDEINARRLIAEVNRIDHGNESQEYSESREMNIAYLENTINKEDIINKEIEEKELEIYKNAKTGVRLIIEEHKLLNILFFKDSNSFRITRCSLLFIFLMGKMYFIGLFYQYEQKKNINSFKDAIESYTLRDFLVFVYSTIIVTVANAILKACFKTEKISLLESRQIIMLKIKSNKLKKTICIFISWAILGFYSWGISLFALSLDYSLSVSWILNTGIGYAYELSINPLLKLGLRAFILSKIVIYFKIQFMKNKIYNFGRRKIESNKHDNKDKDSFN